MTPSSPWAWASADSSERLWADIRRDGHTLFTDPHALSRSGDPVAFSQHLFGLRPVRYQRMLVEPSAGGNQRSMPKTMFAGALHNDCAQLGMPPQIQVMVCERQSAMGGDSLVLDLWPVLERIANDDPALLRALFQVSRALPSGHTIRYGLTWTLMRGNLVCQHPTRARSGHVGLAFQRFIDQARPARFKCQPGDVYVNNNHRCLHGRDAFNDPTRRFIRLLYWFAEPLAAPAHLLALARMGCAQLAESLAAQAEPVQRLFGVSAWRESAGQAKSAAQLLGDLLLPTNCDRWQGPGQRQLLRQEALLDMVWQMAAGEGDPEPTLQQLQALVQEGA